MYVRVPVPKFNKYMHYYDTYRSAMGIVFTENIISVGTKYDANLEIMSCPSFILSTAPYIKIL